MLYVEEGESVKRQLARGKAVTAFNKRVSETGVGKLIPVCSVRAMAWLRHGLIDVRYQVRSTDVSEDLAKGRYRAFKEEVYAALTTVKTKLPFHFVPAGTAAAADARYCACCMLVVLPAAAAAALGAAERRLPWIHHATLVDAANQIPRARRCGPPSSRSSTTRAAWSSR